MIKQSCISSAVWAPLSAAPQIFHPLFPFTNTSAALLWVHRGWNMENSVRKNFFLSTSLPLDDDFFSLSTWHTQKAAWKFHWKKLSSPQVNRARWTLMKWKFRKLNRRNASCLSSLMAFCIVLARGWRWTGRNGTEIKRTQKTERSRSLLSEFFLCSAFLPFAKHRRACVCGVAWLISQLRWMRRNFPAPKNATIEAHQSVPRQHDPEIPLVDEHHEMKSWMKKK